jgi:site-specific recombinase XerD
MLKNGVIISLDFHRRMILREGDSLHDSFILFLSNLQAKGKQPKTISTYEGVLKQFARWVEETTGETYSPEQVTPIDVAEYRRYLLERFKPATINKILVTLKTYFHELIQQRYLTESPVSAVRMVQQGRKAPRWLSRKEQLALIRQVQKGKKPRHKRDLAIIQLLLHTGLRLEELCNLRLEDIQISERKGKVVIRQGKGLKWREVPLNKDVRDALNQYIGVRESNSLWYFTSTRSDQMTTRSVQFLVQKYANLANLEHCSPHTLRHTFCHELAVRGTSLDIIATLAGHMTADGRPNVATTAIYTTPGEQDLRRAVDRLSWE